MTPATFRIGSLSPGLHLSVSEDPIRFAMNDERLAQALAEQPPRSWRFIDSDSTDVPVYLYWEGICVEAPRKPRTWVIDLLTRLEKSRQDDGGVSA